MHGIDPDSRPEITGTQERFLINLKGEPDGQILTDGREVHFPPHMGEAFVAALTKGPKAPIRIRAVKPRNADVFAAVSLQLGDGPRLEDEGSAEKAGRHEKPEKPGNGEAKTTVSGEVRKALHGPQGETRGFLLKSGEIVRFPPQAHAAVAHLLKTGAKVAAEGRHVRTPLGEVIDARRIGADEDNLAEWPRPKPHHD